MGKVLKFLGSILFSHIGFCVIICGYIVGGAFLMRYIELPEEKKRHVESRTLAQLIEDHRAWSAEEIFRYCTNDTSSRDAIDGPAHIKKLLDTYHTTIVRARMQTAGYGRQAYRGKNEYQEIYGWSIGSSILFTASILSTIEQPPFQLYSVFAIPLMSMFLVNTGGLLMNGIRVFFVKGCCAFVRRKRNQSRVAAQLNREPRLAWEEGRYQYLSSKDDGLIPSWDNGRRNISHGESTHLQDLVPAGIGVCLFLGYVVLGMGIWHTVASGEPGWTLIESAYFSIVSVMTIGFGDYVPGYVHGNATPNEVVMGCCALFIIVGSIILTTAVGLIFEGLKSRKNQRLASTSGVYPYDGHYKEADLTPPYTH